MSLLVGVCASGAAAGLYATWSRPSLEAAKRAIERGEIERADTILDQLTARGDDRSEVRLLAAQLAADRGDLSKSLEHLQAIRATDAASPEALLRQGRCWRRLGYGRRAEEAWRAAMQSGTTDTAADWELLHLVFEEGRFLEAERLAWQIHEKESEKLPALLFLIRCELERPAPHAGMEAASRYASRDRQDWNAKFALGRYQVLLGNAEGRELLEQCWKHDPDQPDFARAYAWSLGELGEYDTLKQLAKDPPRELAALADFWRLAGEALEPSDPPAAREAFERSLWIDPHGRKAQFQLGELLRRLGDSEAARRHLDRAAELQHTRQALGDHAAKIQGLLRSAQPVSPQDSRHMAALTATLGRTRESEAWQQQAAERNGGLGRSEAADGAAGR